MGEALWNVWKREIKQRRKKMKRNENKYWVFGRKKIIIFTFFTLLYIYIYIYIYIIFFLSISFCCFNFQTHHTKGVGSRRRSYYPTAWQTTVCRQEMCSYLVSDWASELDCLWRKILVETKKHSINVFGRVGFWMKGSEWRREFEILCAYCLIRIMESKWI